MPLEGTHLGAPVSIPDLAKPHQEFYAHCSSGVLHLQHCSECDLVRYPTTTACPWCMSPEYNWKPMSGKGHVYSYAEIHHAIQPAFREHTPYALLLVELDEQKDQPNEYDGLRLNGNLVTNNGVLAPPDLVAQIGIGSRVRVIMNDLGEGIALPQWVLDDSVKQPENVWRYPD